VAPNALRYNLGEQRRHSVPDLLILGARPSSDHVVERERLDRGAFAEPKTSNFVRMD
jgi:hypothetical protein